MTTKQVFKMICGHIMYLIVAITVIGMKFYENTNEIALYFMYFGKGAIAAYLGSKIEKEIQNFFE